MFGSCKCVERIEDCGNGFGFSIIEWEDDDFYDGYEFAVLRDGSIYYDTPITSDVVRGDWGVMLSLKKEVENLPALT
jgi:hypothetical protein